MAAKKHMIVGERIRAGTTVIYKTACGKTSTKIQLRKTMVTYGPMVVDNWGDCTCTRCLATKQKIDNKKKMARSAFKEITHLIPQDQRQKATLIFEAALSKEAER